jgi:uncharacterized membrane protein YedE/YeeE
MQQLSVNEGNLSNHQTVSTKTGDGVLQYLVVLLIGTFFGIVLVKSEVVSWYRIQKMFLFEELHMYLIIGSAVVVGAISLAIIKHFQLSTIDKRSIVIRRKQFQKGTIIGGIAFGMGWAITGACPGPIYAQIGSGEYIAVVTFAAALIGMYLYAFLQPKLPH